MKKLLLVIIAITLLTSSSCSETKNYVIDGSSSGNEAPSMVFSTFEDYLDESDIIVEIQITEKLGETDDPDYKTFFNAEVITILKGDENLETLNFMQGVNSKYIYEGYQIFKVGQKLVLFMSKASGEQYSDDMYWIRGGHLSVIRIDNINGKEYANKLNGTFKDFVFENKENAFKSLRYEREILFKEIIDRLNIV